MSRWYVNGLDDECRYPALLANPDAPHSRRVAEISEVIYGKFRTLLNTCIEMRGLAGVRFRCGRTYKEKGK
jgi:hypothetical protein